MSRNAKNANRRLGDRLWSPAGREYTREITTGYYLNEAELRSAVSELLPRVALQRDHSAIEWPDAGRAARILADLQVKKPLKLGNCLFLPTSGRTRRRTGCSFLRRATEPMSRKGVSWLEGRMVSVLVSVVGRPPLYAKVRTGRSSAVSVRRRIVADVGAAGS
jgi:hypothetical protein